MIDLILKNCDKILTIFFAWLSAVFAGISAWLLWLEYRRNNAIVKTRMNFAVFSDAWNSHRLIIFRLENHGRRKIIFSDFYFLTSIWESIRFLETSDIFFAWRPHFPVELNEQDFFDVKIAQDNFFNYLLEEGKEIDAVYFLDTVWNHYVYKLSKENKKSFPKLN